jgi:hypothetical protein
MGDATDPPELQTYAGYSDGLPAPRRMYSSERCVGSRQAQSRARPNPLKALDLVLPNCICD